jgi:hypothetical protein
VLVDFAYLLDRPMGQFVRPFQPLNSLQPYAVDQFSPVTDQIPAFPVVANTATRVDVIRFEPQGWIATHWPVVAGMSQPGSVIGISAGNARLAFVP